MTGQAKTQGGQPFPELARLVLRVNLDALTDQEVREVGRRILFEGWAHKAGTVERTFFAELSHELTGEVARSRKVEKSKGER